MVYVFYFFSITNKIKMYTIITPTPLKESRLKEILSPFPCSDRYNIPLMCQDKFRLIFHYSSPTIYISTLRHQILLRKILIFPITFRTLSYVFVSPFVSHNSPAYLTPSQKVGGTINENCISFKFRKGKFLNDTNKRFCVQPITHNVCSYNVIR